MQSPDSSRLYNKDVSGELSIKKSLASKIVDNLLKISFIKKLSTKKLNTEYKKEKTNSVSDFIGVTTKVYRRLTSRLQKEEESKQNDKKKSINSYSQLLMDLIALTKVIAAGAVINVASNMLDLITKTFGKSIEGAIGKSLFKIAEKKINTQKNNLEDNTSKGGKISNLELQMVRAESKAYLNREPRKEVKKDINAPLQWDKKIEDVVTDLTRLNDNAKGKDLKHIEDAKDKKSDLHFLKNNCKVVSRNLADCKTPKPISLKDKNDLSGDFLEKIFTKDFKSQILSIGLSIKAANTKLQDDSAIEDIGIARSLYSDQRNKKQELCTSF